MENLISFPPEVMMEILSWIPLKYLLRFRCVNKTWLQLLTNDQIFAKLHLDRCSHYEPSILAVRKERCRCNQKNNPPYDPQCIPTPKQRAPRKKNDPTCPGKAVFYFAEECRECDKGIDLPLPFDQTHNRCIVYGICNGLVLFWSFDHERQVYLWNPLMKNYITIQSPPIPAGFCWEHEDANGTFGFGFHEAANQYKVIRFFNESDKYQTRHKDYQLRVSVYTLGIDLSWRTLEETFPYYLGFITYLPPLVNGALHWLMFKTGYLSSKLIVSFDLKDEVFREMLIPADVSKPGSTIGELGGLLYYYSCEFCVDYDEVQIWMMKEYGAVWKKQYIILVDFIDGFLVPLGFAKNGELILEKSFSDQLMLCNHKANLISHCKSFKFEFDQVYTYVGSLISPTVISRVRAT